MSSLDDLLGISATQQPTTQPMTGDGSTAHKQVSFSFLFFSDVRKDVSDAQKYEFMRDITLFGDREGFEAIYIPERHFHEFGSIYANSAVMAAYLIPQTQSIRFRTAGVSLPLHHPAEVVEWWAMNDILSGGRVDLGFGSGWSQPDFILSPETYHDRRVICRDRIPIIQKLWRGEMVVFSGVDGKEVNIQVFPRPVQKELNVWLLAAQSDESFRYAGQQGYNIFTMLSGINLETMQKKIALYRAARKEAGYNSDTGTVSLMLHTLIHENKRTVQAAVEKPFKEYIRSSLNAHVQSGTDQSKGAFSLGEEEKRKMLDYAYQRYFSTGALFGSVAEAKEVVDQAIEIGVDEIACLVDFGVDYSVVLQSLPFLKQLTSQYI